MKVQGIKNAHRNVGAVIIATVVACGVIVENVGRAEIRITEGVGRYILEAGHPSLAEWKLPPLAPASDIHGNALTDLGRRLFFDKRLSADKTRSCATCHRPELGWSDGLPTARGLDGKPLARATPGLANVAYGSLFNWDGRVASLEEQALGPVFSQSEMGSDAEELVARLEADRFYREAFTKLFPNQPLNEKQVGLALAAFERTLLVQDTRFDRWVAGESGVLTDSEIRGFGVFIDPNRGSCGTCHAPPNFTDNGFHNIGLESFGHGNPDLGRYKIRPVRLMRGAFKTPPLRNIALSAPYFHDGSAATLEDVIEHYRTGGVVKENLSPEMKVLRLNAREKSDLVAFLKAISNSHVNFSTELALEQQ